MSEAEYAIAYQAALIALKDVHRQKLREIVAEAVAAFVVGGRRTEGDEKRWASLTADTHEKRNCLSALMRDLKGLAIISTGPVDVAITAAATALLARAEA